MQVVCDTSSLIKLRKAGVLDLLEKIYDTVYLPEAVRDECTDRETDINTKIRDRIFLVQPVAHVLDIGLGAGEREMISLAVEQDIEWVMTDDEQAIRKAKQQKRRVIQFYDVLLAGKKKDLILSVKTCLDTMRVEGEGIERDLYEEILRLAGE